MGEVSIIKNKFIDYVDQIIDNGKVSHAFLIEIDDYDNDFSYVNNFIKMILSNSSYESVLNSDSPSFYQIDHFNYPDVKIIEPDGMWIKKSQMIELQKDYVNKSLLDNKRIYVIKNAEKLNSASANTMLKFLEEPEDNIIAILLTENRYHVLDTILSRCQILTLKDDFFSITIDSIVIDFIYSIIHPDHFFLKYSFYFIEVIPEKDRAKELLNTCEKIILSYIRDGSVSDPELEKIFQSVSFHQLLSKISILEDYLPKLDYNINYKLWLDSLFSQLSLGG